jgi:hypothetical protein
MTEMIERVARAMMKVTAKRPGDGTIELPVLSMDPDFDDLPENSTEGTVDDEVTKEAVMRLARAAIEAMREPTQEMMAAVDCGGEKAEWLSGRAWKTGYTSMVEAALGHPRSP